MSAAALACTAAAAAAAAGIADSAQQRLRRLAGPAAGGVRARRRLPGLQLAIVVTVAAVATSVLGGHLPILLLSLTGLALSWAVATLRARARAARRSRGTQRQVTELCDALAAELVTGAPPSVVLEHAAVDWPIVAPVSAAARLGGDVVAAFGRAAQAPGAEALRSVGAAWQVSARSGASLGGVLDRLAVTLRADEEARREVESCLSAPRATARVLAVLPVVGLALGTGVGSDPVQVLTGSLIGAGSVAAGAALAVAGLFWVDRIAAQAQS